MTSQPAEDPTAVIASLSAHLEEANDLVVHLRNRTAQVRHEAAAAAAAYGRAIEERDQRIAELETELHEIHTAAATAAPDTPAEEA